MQPYGLPALLTGLQSSMLLHSSLVHAGMSPLCIRSWRGTLRHFNLHVCQGLMAAVKECVRVCRPCC